MADAGQVVSAVGSKVLGDEFELPQRLPRRRSGCTQGVVETMIDVVMNQLLLCRSDSTLDSMQLLRHVKTGTIFQQHVDHVLQMTMGPLEAFCDSVMRNVESGFRHIDILS